MYRAWWHASVALIPLLLFARPSAERLTRLELATAVVLFVWAVQLQRFAWGGHVWDLPSKLVTGLPVAQRTVGACANACFANRPASSLLRTHGVAPWLSSTSSTSDPDS